MQYEEFYNQIVSGEYVSEQREDNKVEKTLLSASIDTLEKYDRKQVANAIPLYYSGNSRGFTNENGNRDRLEKLIPREEIYKVIRQILLNRHFVFPKTINNDILTKHYVDCVEDELEIKNERKMRK